MLFSKESKKYLQRRRIRGRIKGKRDEDE